MRGLALWLAACAPKESPPPTDSAAEDSAPPAPDSADSAPLNGDSGCGLTTGALTGLVIHYAYLTPSPSARVLAWRSEGDSIETLAGDDGVYAFAALEAGEWLLSAESADGYCATGGTTAVGIAACDEGSQDLVLEACVGR